MSTKQVTSRRLSRRTLLAGLLIFVVIPATILLGIFVLDDRKYYFISLLIVLYTMIPFAMVFENRKPQARELIVIAVLAAIAVAGRAAFFMLPQFKPVVAIVIIAGVSLGAEAGFLVGAVAGFVSNFFLVRDLGRLGKCSVLALLVFWRAFSSRRVCLKRLSCLSAFSEG